MIVISSHAVRLYRQLQQFCTDPQQHDSALVKISIVRIGGTTAKDQLKHSTLFEIPKAYRPAVVYILLGRNDLDSRTSAEETGELLMSFCKKLEELASTKHCLLLNMHTSKISTKTEQFGRNFRNTAPQQLLPSHIQTEV